jgi:hypothetical protein
VSQKNALCQRPTGFAYMRKDETPVALMQSANLPTCQRARSVRQLAAFDWKAFAAVFL